MKSKNTKEVLEEMGDELLEQVKESIGGQSNFGLITLFGPILMETIREPVNIILKSNLDPDSNFHCITMLICSQGGELPAIMALTDVMIGSKIPIHTVGIGMVASGGLMVLMAGDKGNRTITPNTQVMSHQWSGGSFGKKHELVASRKEQDILTNIMLSFYKKHSKIKSKKKIESVLLPASDVWLSSKEALDLGLCDKVKTLNNKTVIDFTRKSI